MAPGLLCVPLVLGFLLLLPGTRSDCGPPPKRSDAIPDTNQIEVFSVGTLVAYRCRDGFVKIPGKSNTITCLSNSQWSNLQEFCGRSCGVPTRLKFAALKKEDESKSYYPVGINVSYTCRPGFENTTQMLPGSTCLENLTWSEVPELCKRKSCGDPGELLNGRPVKVTDNLFGAKIQFVCEDGYKLVGRSFIQCGLKGDKVEWSSLPTCQVISCSPPPAIANGTYNDSGVKNFVYNTTVTYRCEPGFRLSSTPFIWCTTRDKTSGIWSGPAPECKARIQLQEEEKQDEFSGSSTKSNGSTRVLSPENTNQSRRHNPQSIQNNPSTITSSRSSSSPRGPRSWLSKRTRAWQSCCYNRLPIRCKSPFHS